jgi:hypothetical protein
MGIGTMSATTLANCGICESTIMREMQEGCYVVNDVLPERYRSDKSKMVNVAKLFAKLDKQEQEQLAKAKLQAELVRREQIIQAYKRQAENGATTLAMITTLEDELRIDNTYLACYADFVKLEILEPVTYDEMMEYEGTDE